MRRRFILLTLVFMLLPFHHSEAEELHNPIKAKLKILQTTDIHANILDYDYKNNNRTIEYGLSRTASLIQKIRSQNENTLLFDVGDMIKGNALADFIAKSPFLPVTDIHPAYKTMNLLQYDAATVGNHEFNYGLDFLLKTVSGADFPVVNANIYIDDHNQMAEDDLHFFNPYTIMPYPIKTEAGTVETINVGVIGLLTPIAAEWDKEYFEDNLIIKNMSETAAEIVPIMKKAGADIIIALVHAGLQSDDALKDKRGNNVVDVSKVEGIDVLLYGHSHSLFPKKGEKNIEGINHQAGTINKKPAVQAGFWGNHLGIIDLSLEKRDSVWKIAASKSQAKPIIRIINGKKVPVVSPYQPIEYLMEPYHQETLEYVKTLK
ncbi:metallophosphoesterase [Niallia sp. BSM11]|uniref:metallophosphoesterase n=1 Tax=Niallia sp. BSM11 TaxID=3391576 RepID=UPI0039850716